MGKHPMQPVALDADGTAHFKANKIVRTLLDMGPLDMNKLAMLEFSQEDRVQFAQLIGYSVNGFGELSYVSDADYAAASEAADLAVNNAKRHKKLLGYQLADATGKNIQGDDDDPTGLASFEIMDPLFARAFAENDPAFRDKGLLLMPIYEGQIEEPTIVYLGGQREKL